MATKTLRTRSLWLGLALLLAACAGGPPPQPPVPREPQPAKPEVSAEVVRQRAIAHFLARAEAAQREGYLTEPAGASAYDYYLYVNQMDPGNKRAAAGILTIVLQLVEQARDALRSRAFAQTNSLLNAAEQLAPANPLTAELRAQLVRERSEAQAQAQVSIPGAETVALPAAELSTQSEAILALLRDTAARIRRDNLRVIIIARSDAEGRWIYGQLREAAAGYRVRGDIKVGSPPRLLLSAQE